MNENAAMATAPAPERPIEHLMGELSELENYAQHVTGKVIDRSIMLHGRNVVMEICPELNEKAVAEAGCPIEKDATGNIQSMLDTVSRCRNQLAQVDRLAEHL